MSLTVKARQTGLRSSACSASPGHQHLLDLMKLFSRKCIKCDCESAKCPSANCTDEHYLSLPVCNIFFTSQALISFYSNMYLFMNIPLPLFFKCITNLKQLCKVYEYVSDLF